MRPTRVALFSLLGIVAVLVLVMTVAVVVVLSVDLSRYKPNAEELVSGRLGREFRIGGAFEPSLGRSIRLVAEDVRLAGTEWSDASDLVSVKRIELSIDTWSLFRGPIIVEMLSVEGMRINLEELADGRNNWTMSTPQAADVELAADGEGIDDLPVMLNELRVDDFALNYLSPSLRRPLNVSLDEVHETIGETGDLQLRISGQVNDKRISITAMAGKVENLVALRDVALRLDGELGEISFQGNAAIDDLLAPRRPTGQLLLRGPNAEYLTDALGLDPVTTGPLSLATSMAPAGQRMNIAARGVFGEFTLDVGGSLVDLGNWSDIDIRAAAAGPNAAAIGRLMGNDTVPEDPFRITAVARIAGKNIEIDAVNVEIGETRFDASGEFANFPSPGGASLALDISGPDFGRFNKLLGLPGKLTGPFKLDATLAQLPDGNASLKLDANAQALNFTVDGILVDQPDFMGSTVDVKLHGADFNVIAQAAGLFKAPSVDFDARISAKKTLGGVQLDDSFARIGKDKALISGLVGNDPLKLDTNLTIEAAGPDLKGSLSAFGVEAAKLQSGPFSAKGRIYRQADHFVVQDLRATIGANEEYLLRADGRVTDDPKRIGSVGKVSVNGSSLAALADTAGISGMPDSQFKVTADVERVSDGYRVSRAIIQLGKDSLEITGLAGEPPLLQNTDLQFKLMTKDLKLSLASFEIPADKVPSGQFVATGQIRYSGEAFALQNISASLAGAELKASGKLGGLPSLNGTDIDIRLAGDKLSSLLPSSSKFEAQSDAFSARGKLRLANNVLSIASADVRLGEARLTGSVSTAFKPAFSKGSFALQANAPDLGHLVAEFEKHVSSAKVPMTFRTTGDWDDNFWSFDEFLLTIARGSLSIAGTLDGPPDFEHTDLRVDLNIDNVRNLSNLVGRTLPSEPVTLHGHLTGTHDEMTLTEFVAKLGASDIDGQFLLRDGETPTANIKIMSNRLDLSGYLPPLEEPVAKPASGTPAATRTRLIPDTPVPMEKLRKFDADVDIRFGELKLRQRPMTDVRLVASLKAGDLKVSDFSLTGRRGGSLSGGVHLKPAGSGAELLLGIHGRKLSLGLRADTPEEFDALPQYDVDFVLHGSGLTAAEVAGSFNGYARLVSGPGHTRAGAAGFFTQDVILQLLNSLNPFTKTEPYTNVKCLVILGKVTDGMVTGKPALVLQTDKLNAFANAEVDLKTEKLDVELNMVPQKGIGIALSDMVTPYTRIGGTLAHPAMVLDPEGVLIEGGVAVATVGLSILAKRFKERYLSAKDACGKAIEDTSEEFEKLDAQYVFE